MTNEYQLLVSNNKESKKLYVNIISDENCDYLLHFLSEIQYNQKQKG